MRDENKQSRLVELLQDFTSGQIRQFTYKFGGVFKIESNRLDKAIRAARYIKYKNKKRIEGENSC